VDHSGVGDALEKLEGLFQALEELVLVAIEGLAGGLMTSIGQTLRV
jgi:hypothetical protein